MKKPLLIFGALGALVAIVAAWYLLSPLFINTTVDEAFPSRIPAPEELAKMSQEELAKIKDGLMDKTSEIPATVVEEPMPSFSEKATPSPPIIRSWSRRRRRPASFPPTSCIP